MPVTLPQISIASCLVRVSRSFPLRPATAFFTTSLNPFSANHLRTARAPWFGSKCLVVEGCLEGLSRFVSALVPDLARLGPAVLSLCDALSNGLVFVLFPRFFLSLGQNLAM